MHSKFYKLKCFETQHAWLSCVKSSATVMRRIMVAKQMSNTRSQKPWTCNSFVGSQVVRKPQCFK